MHGRYISICLLLDILDSSLSLSELPLIHCRIWAHPALFQQRPLLTSRVVKQMQQIIQTNQLLYYHIHHYRWDYKELVL